jgi:ABC-2 type transport system ATP-binding protein
MDEAERCHRIVYIAYGRIIARGTAGEVIASSGLTTWLVSGRGLQELAKALRGRPGVDQATPFGTTLHVTGSDAAALERAIAPYRAVPGTSWTRGETSLEDVFIRLMAEARDQYG